MAHGGTAGLGLLLLLLAAAPPQLDAMVIQRVFGANNTEIAFASGGGGTHMYLAGTGIGSAFSPPTVFIGINADATCVVQPFTSTRNRLHCIISAEGLPPPDVQYNPAGRLVDHPIRVYKSGRLAQCWHVGSENHGCVVRFDLGATPRVTRVVTPVLRSGGVLRLRGLGIDGGLSGTPGMIATVFRGQGQLVVGACGEKDCAPSNMGLEVIGCKGRTGGSGDGVEGQNSEFALAYSDDSHYGCQLDSLAEGLTGGFFNMSVHAMDEKHRGDAYLGFLANERVDFSSGDPFTAELLPVITGVTPSLGSLAGGADLTITGTGFGSDLKSLMITAGHGGTGAKCAITSITPEGVHCRVEPLAYSPTAMVVEPPPSNLAGQAHVRQSLGSHASHRGVRFQWLDDGAGSEPSHGANGVVTLPDFSAPLDYEAGKAGSKVCGQHACQRRWHRPKAAQAADRTPPPMPPAKHLLDLFHA